MREQGIPTEIFHEVAALKKQIRYADRKGIPFMLFPHQYTEETQLVEVKDLKTGDQVQLPLQDWIKSQQK